jgi:lysophospholipase L1-like esterase
MFSQTRFQFLFAVVLVLVAFSATATEELADRPTPLHVKVGEEIAADIVHLIFLFDRVATKSSSVTSRDFLERVSEPSSPFYEDYLEYRSGRISRSELVRRLPHVAMMGDSLSQNFYFSAPISAFWRARTERRKNWFLDTDPSSSSIFSVYERLHILTPLVATEYSGSGALVAPSREPEGLRRRIIRTRNLSGQTRRILGRQRFPDLIMIWIGHNNIDWVEGLSAREREHPENHLRAMATRFRKNYTESLQALIDRAKIEHHRVAIVVFGLVNLESFSKGNRAALALHVKNPKFYPYVESGYRSFESVKPQYHSNMIRLGSMMNNEMQLMVHQLNQQLKGSGNVRLEYSNALNKVDFSRLEMINSADGWHPSVQGQKALAEAGFNALGPSLKFLQIIRHPSSRAWARPAITRDE